ncbi:MAG TPA: hypothetical protein VJO72_12545 [Candidatus Dormibacteraeota bacterium]|nr:hypothetical protein [Candidatus Dormibacteraeota bacterium]
MLLGAVVLGLTLTALPAAAGEPAGTVSVDSLWNQPGGLNVDSGWYFLQQWWDQAALTTTRDRTQRGLAELAQANTNLLNAYSLLAEANTDPGPHPVPGIDPLLSDLYATVTGVHVKAPVGGFFAGLNQAMLNVEGRGSTGDIIQSLLQNFEKLQQAADRDLAQSPGFKSLWAANSLRQAGVIANLQALAGEVSAAASLRTAVTDLDHQRKNILTEHDGLKD